MFQLRRTRDPGRPDTIVHPVDGPDGGKRIRGKDPDVDTGSVAGATPS